MEIHSFLHWFGTLSIKIYEKCVERLKKTNAEFAVPKFNR